MIAPRPLELGATFVEISAIGTFFFVEISAIGTFFVEMSAIGTSLLRLVL